jgi:hypothetical protein
VGVVVFVGRNLGAVDTREVRECLFVFLELGPVDLVGRCERLQGHCEPNRRVMSTFRRGWRINLATRGLSPENREQ